MTKESMIWQILSMIIAGMAVNKNLPETKEQFFDKVVTDAMGIIDYPREDIERVLKTTNCIEFAEILCSLYTEPKTI
jgi:hypothetical protein